ncbi:hypothetical protein NW762_012920 [Fusarium torreyae]|uniref:Uncharacterized protein n=1 Tax=Fusarium torreyae TaxID=1237075 RepID=A0A9W8RPP6_9HYPO|nr:hypothetical protein NW762_012920 [Fusarium torreyae]
MQQDRDVTYPLRSMDDLKLLRMLVMHVALVFDERLDPTRLYTSLDGVVRMDGWYKLGARLRRKGLWGLEYHVPAKFTDERPAFSYAHTTHSCSRREHPEGSRLPASDSGISVGCESEEYLALIQPFGAPTRLRDYVNQDRPLLGLYIVSFNDATIIAISWPHVLFDIMSLADLYQAWILNLQGQGQEIRIPVRAELDFLLELGNNAQETHHLTHRRMSTWELISFGLRNISVFLFPAMERRTICISAATFERIRATTVTEASESQLPGSDNFLSDNDVLCAWWSRICCARLKDSNREVAIINVQSFRSALPVDLLPKCYAYLSNALGLITTLLPVRNVVKSQLGPIALEIRTSVQKSGKRSQMEAFESLRKRAWHREWPIFASTTTYPIIYTNWSKARIFHLDFSAALAEDNVSLPTRPVKPSLVLPIYSGWKAVDLACIPGRDADGNFWLDFSTERENWPAILLEIGYSHT